MVKTGTMYGVFTLVWGCDRLPEPIPPHKGFPEGKIKFKFRPKAVGMAHVLTESGIRRFYVKHEDGYLQPAWEMGRNHHVS